MQIETRNGTVEHSPGGPHLNHHRPPAEHGAGRGQDLRREAGGRRRERGARGTVGEGGRGLRENVRGANTVICSKDFWTF